MKNKQTNKHQGGRWWRVDGFFFYHFTYFSFASFFLSPSMIGAGGGKERLEKKVQVICISLTLLVVFCWLTISVFNHDYGRYLKSGIDVWDLGKLPLRSCSSDDLLSCSFPLTELSLWQSPSKCLVFATCPIGNSCILSRQVVEDSLPNFWFLLSHSAKQAVLASFLLLVLSLRLVGTLFFPSCYLFLKLSFLLSSLTF